FYGIGAETVERMLAEMPGASEAAEAAAAQAAAAPADLEATEASIIKFANQVIEEAFNGGSTDVHFEPFEGSLRVRYRIDGMLDDVTVPPTLSRFYSAIVSRIKVMAGLNIAEKRRPQDGRISAKVRAHDLDLRVSILPALQGESVHIRLLERDAPLYGLEDLGLLPNGVELFRRALR
ncbi:MAG: type II/IV secretion system protein, partial [Planctomycetes bacterium]|nr:type II/IV secretion system protein [Planctomycetota bacterium]